MSKSLGAIKRLRDDLRQPGGGWTTGVLTLLAAMAPIPIELFGYWPGPEWSVTVAMMVLLAAHMMWGAHGYYSRRV